MQLYPFQRTAIDQAENILGDRRRVMISAPTGTGKTLMAGHMMADVPSAFLVDRVVLVDQAVRTFERMGLEVGVRQGARTRDTHYQIQVCSMPTIERRKTNLRQFKRVIVDEAHILRAGTAEMLKDAYEHGTQVIGLSATPLRGGLYELYGDVVQAGTVNKLTPKYLTPIIPYAAEEIDRKRLRIRNGEYRPDDNEKALLEITGDVVSEWERLTEEHFGGRVPTVIYAPTVHAGAKVQEMFAARGYDFRQLSYHARDKLVERENMDAFEGGECNGLINCEVLTRGYDAPWVRCIVMLRAYLRSSMQVVQIAGRGMRIFPGKEDFLLIDHCGNWIGHLDVIQHLFRNGVRYLHKGEEAEKLERKDLETGSDEHMKRVCKGCGYIFSPGEYYPCPRCDQQAPERLKKTMEHNPGTLNRIGHGSENVPIPEGHAWVDICTIIEQRYYNAAADKKRKMALAIYKNLNDEWPPRGSMFSPLERHKVNPGTVVEFDRSRREYAKGKKGE